jgi:predicted SnoaL-like aldol condensation-catalyzing enzyme
VPKEDEMTQTIEEKNKAFVLEAFEALFNKRDYAAAERFWSPSYIQHSKHIPPGRDGLLGLVKASPQTMRYENGAILAEGNLLMLHGPSLASACRRTGLWWMSCVWRTATWPSIGTSSKTRPRAKHLSAVCPCSGRHFPRNDLARVRVVILHQQWFDQLGKIPPSRGATQ